jgi:hypothetical protein
LTYRTGEEEEDAVVYRRPSHDYGSVEEGGLRTHASARIVLATVPEVRPETLSEENLHPRREILILPLGIMLDPPAGTLRFPFPESNAVVPDTFEIQLEASGVTQPILLLGRDLAGPEAYELLATLEGPRFGEERTITATLDLSSIGASGSFELLAVSSADLVPDAQGLLAPSAVPTSAPHHSILLRKAAAILEPVPGEEVGTTGIVRIATFLSDGYAFVMVRPGGSNDYWVQDDPSPIVGRELRIQVHYGGREEHEVYVGITRDETAVRRGEQLASLPATDSEGEDIILIGPVTVRATVAGVRD